MIISGEWAVTRLIQGGRWILRLMKLKHAGSIARVGKTSKKYVKSAMDKRNPLHSVPRVEKAAGYIDDFANLIKQNSFDINQSIPATIKKWKDVSQVMQKRLLDSPNGSSYLNYLK